MQELKEGVLAIGAGFAEENRACRAFDRRAIERHRFAVRFHFELLEIGGKAREPLIVRDHRMGGIIPKIPIPDAEERHEHGNILLKRR